MVDNLVKKGKRGQATFLQTIAETVAEKIFD